MNRSSLTIFGRLLVLVKPLTFHMIIAVVTGVLGFICASFVTVFGGYLLLEILKGNAVFWIIGLMMLFAVLRGVLHYIEHACNHYIAFKLLAIIRSKIFGALRKLAPAKLESESRGKLISVITGDIELLEIFFAHTISPICIAFLMMIFNLYLFSKVHIYFVLIAFIGYLFVGVCIPIYMSKCTKELGVHKRENVGTLNNYFLDHIRGLQEVLQFNIEQKVLNHIDEKTNTMQQVDKRLKRYLSFTFAFTNCSIIGFTVCISFFGLQLVQSNQILVEHYLLCILLMYSSFGPFVALANLGGGLSGTLASGNRILDILDEEPLVEDVLAGSEITDSMCFDNVSFKYEDDMIVDNQSFKIPNNKIFGISGKSGSGKSTMLNLMMRFYDVSLGNITLGNDIKKINTRSLRTYQSYVTQQTHLFNDTIENNLKIAKLDATNEEIVDACKKASIHDFIMSLEHQYQTNVGELGNLMSGGQKQRLGLARAFLHGGSMMVLDEPTSNLDSYNEAVILKSIKEDKDRTVVLVSHRQSTMNICDEVLEVKSTRSS